MRSLDRLLHERRAASEGASRIAGVDEAGRGPLAGPVVAAAVILCVDFDATGIDDSKKLTPAARASAYARLSDDPRIAIAVVAVEPDEIDRLNILRATHEGMRRALAALPGDPPDCVLVDGLPVPGLHPNCRAIVQGDSQSLSIAAASIVAKVTRDRLMIDIYHERYPQYDFARHKGYPTAGHLAALSRHGPCPIHRRSFGPVSQLVLRFTEGD